MTVIFLGAGSFWSVPNDWNNSANKIEVIAGGGGGASAYTSSGGGTGGGGGAYSAIFNLILTPGTNVPFTIGGGGGNAVNGNGGNGGNTWFNGASYGTASVAAQGGYGGVIANSFATSTPGGQASNGIGAIRYSGGAGGPFSNALVAGTGGGGAAGLYGNGIDGDTENGSGPAFDLGGGSNGGAGDQGAGGAGGTWAFLTNGNPGGNGTEYGPYGSGGGGAGATTALGGNGGAFGGGGGGCGFGGGSYASGTGYPGLIVITYTPIVTGNFTAVSLATSSPTFGTPLLIMQMHATSLAPASPVFGTPASTTYAYAFIATGLATGSPSFSALPPMGTIPVLFARNLAPGSPVFGVPTHLPARPASSTIPPDADRHVRRSGTDYGTAIPKLAATRASVAETSRDDARSRMPRAVRLLGLRRRPRRRSLGARVRPAPDDRTAAGLGT